MKFFLLVILSFLLFSCGPKTVDTHGGLIIEVELKGDISSINSTIEVLKRRVDIMGIENPNFIFDQNNNRLQLQLPQVKDSNIFKNYILNSGTVEVHETYNYSELLNSIRVVSETHNNWAEENRDPSLDEILAAPNTIYNSYSDGPIIGFSRTKDTALVSSIIESKLFKETISDDIVCVWGPKDFNGLYSLTAIKKSPMSKIVKTSMIDKSQVKKGNNNDYLVNIGLKQEYHKLWEEITRKNIGRSLSIVVNQQVLSSPIVHSEIKEGLTSISGFANKEEALAIHSLITTGEFSSLCEVNILSINNVP